MNGQKTEWTLSFIICQLSLKVDGETQLYNTHGIICRTYAEKKESKTRRKAKKITRRKHRIQLTNKQQNDGQKKKCDKRSLKRNFYAANSFSFIISLHFIFLFFRLVSTFLCVLLLIFSLLFNAHSAYCMVSWNFFLCLRIFFLHSQSIFYSCANVRALISP